MKYCFSNLHGVISDIAGVDSEPNENKSQRLRKYPIAASQYPFFHIYLFFRLFFMIFIFTGIIPFSRLGGFYANLGLAEIFFATKERGPQYKW